MKTSLALLLPLLLALSAAAEDKPAPEKKPAKLSSGAGWKLTENPLAFPEVQLTGGVGAGLPGLVWGAVGLETHQIFPLLYTDFTLRFSPGVFLGDLENIPYAQPLSIWGRARLGLTFATQPRSSVGFETGYERVGKARVSKIFDVELQKARAHEVYLVGEMRPVGDQLTSFVGLGYGWETTATGQMQWDLGAGSQTRAIREKGAWYIEPRAVLGGPELGYGLFLQTTHRVDWWFLPGFVNVEVGGYYLDGFDYSAVDADSFAFDAMVEVGVAFDLDLSKGPLFFAPLSAAEKARREKARAEREREAAEREAEAKRKAAEEAAEEAKEKAEQAEDKADDAAKAEEEARKKKAAEEAAKKKVEEVTGDDDAGDDAGDDAEGDDDADDGALEGASGAVVGGAAAAAVTPTSAANLGTEQRFTETRATGEPREVVLGISDLTPASSTDSVSWSGLEVLRSPLTEGASWTSGGYRFEVVRARGDDVQVVAEKTGFRRVYTWQSGVGLVRYVESTVVDGALVEVRRLERR